MTKTTLPYCVLFVDDEEKALKYFTRVFEKDYTVLTANSVTKAKLILDEQSNNIGVVISDQRMPEENGVELLKYARKQYPAITRILTTAYSDLDDAIEAVNSGEILRYITKPWDIKVLKPEILQAMQFFQLRRERDELVAEKLSVRQRMFGVNRVRDLIIFASACTLTRNASSAIRSIVEQLPTAATEDNNGTYQTNTWEIMQREIEKMIELSSSTLDAVSGSINVESTAKSSLCELVQKAVQASGLSERVNFELSEQSHSVLCNAMLVEFMLASMIRWATTLSPNGKIDLQLNEGENKSLVSFRIRKGDWAATSLLNIPSELLSAFLACYHLGGKIDLNFESGSEFKIDVSVADEPTAQGLLTDDISWIQKALARFENW